MQVIELNWRYRFTTGLFLFWCVLAWIPDITRLGGSDIGASELVMMLLVVLLCVCKLQHFGSIDYRASKLRVLITSFLIFLFLWGILGVYLADDLFRSGRMFLGLTQGLILLLFVTYILHYQNLLQIVKIGIAMLVLSVLICWVAQFQSDLRQIVFHGKDRAYAMFKHSNQFGIVLAMLVPMASLFVFCGRKSQVIYGLIVLALLFYGLALSGSKTNIIIAIAMLSITVVYSIATRSRRLMLVIVCPIFALLLFYFSLPILELINPRAASIINNFILYGGDGAHSVRQRSYLWDYSLSTIIRSPWFGEGTGQKFFANGELTNHSHNIFLDFGRTIGIPGIVGISAIVFSSVFISVRTLLIIRKKQQTYSILVLAGSCFAVISYVLSNQMSDSFGPVTSFFFWLCLGIVLRRRDMCSNKYVHYVKAGTRNRRDYRAIG